MIPDEVKNVIQSAYRQILESKGLTPRYGQRLMIAEIARSLGGIVDTERAALQAPVPMEGEPDPELPPGPICVVEAGTGTGKTLAYVLGTLPVARHLKKTVILATATVALQEQVTLKDLPDIKRYSDLEFSFTLAKGRGRYLCLSKLDQLLQGNASLNAMADLYGDVITPPNAQSLALYERMFHKLNAGEWQGDRDDWEELLGDQDWIPVTVDNGQCMGQKCSNFSNCCFYKAREEVQKADCVVANHDLVLADLALGGGVILPAPQDSIYIFDEAHHLPLKSNNHFSCFTRLKSSLANLDQWRKSLAKLGGDTLLEENRTVKRELGTIDDAMSLAEIRLNEIWPLCEQVLQSTPRDRQSDRTGENRAEQLQYAFELGQVPESIRELAEELNAQFTRLATVFQDIGNDLKRGMEEGQGVESRQRAEFWFPLVGTMTSRAAAAQKLWQNFAIRDTPGEAPWARWLGLSEQGGSPDISLSCSPVLAARTLQEKLWSVCSGAILTSATLSALGQFEVLRMRAGLPAHTTYHRIASPFDYANAARFIVPKLNCDPSNSVQHTEAIIRMLPKVLNRSEGALMLFSSRRQMTDVLEGLDREWRELILCQDDYQKAQLLKFHKQRIDKGDPSIIFGLASFAEGVDLPGKYCEHVLIAKIPFAVPNDPIEATLSQWIEKQGGNPFMTLAVPEAAFKLVQAAGRLLRNEKDTGRITLFDERIVSKFYGASILNSLPPYRREIFPAELESYSEAP
ncbi:MAG: ATP-dependent DNA helicase DinG [Gammaproteobacteria bacterium]|nr:ATP-dependent DNA helicase DinG [Gammaproteobacteria bacterium]MDP2349455.1 ATP-dependent DNA helicase DinG [Gammaproteobacteria bacterium]